jgi:hypothetical protein
VFKYVVTKILSLGNTILCNLLHLENVLENDVLFAAEVGIITICKDPQLMKLSKNNAPAADIVLGHLKYSK